MSSDRESPQALIRSLAILVVIVLAVKWSVLDANNIPSGSMIPTLKIGDYLFVNKMRYSFRLPFTDWEIFRYDNPRRGDIITFVPPPPESADKHFVKRVMAMPGDRIRIRNVSACELNEVQTGRESPLLMEKHAVAGMAGENPEPMGGHGEGGNGDSLVKFAMESSLERDYSCGVYTPEPGKYKEPVLAILEYRQNDRGEWRTYGVEELPGDRATEILQDSDNVNVLHPSAYPPELRHGDVPVVYRERVGHHVHKMVETASPSGLSEFKLCPDIYGMGCVIPPEHYFVMGDNRDDSRDSRSIGYIPRDSVLGKAVMVYFSINWRDDICRKYAMEFEDVRGSDRGYRIENFPPEEQYRHCSELDAHSGYESLGSYFRRTILYRIPRLAVRWYRIGEILN